MAPTDGSDPAVRMTPMPFDGDGGALLGTTIDSRYRLDALLGRGGMGLVFRATHIELQRQIAVKVLHPSLASSPEVRSRFEREALAVGRIDHPNCVSTFDVGRLADDSLYLAMELLEGRALADVLVREGQLSPPRALHILRHILRGLGSIHAAGIIHRDIKPENIFLVRQESDVDFAKILDFGIAKPIVGELADDGVRLTQAGMAFGTPIYMSPEQALGSKLDGRADLYAAAVIGYEMLTGQLPFYSDDRLEVMAMHATKAVPDMHTRVIDGGAPVPQSIERLIAKGLTKRPEDRYATAEEFLDAIEAAMHTRDGGATEIDIQLPRNEQLDLPPYLSQSASRPGGPSEPMARGPLDPIRGAIPVRTGAELNDAIDAMLQHAPAATAGPPAQFTAPVDRKTGMRSADEPSRPLLGQRWTVAVPILCGAIALGIATAILTTPSRLAHPPPIVLIPRLPSPVEAGSTQPPRGPSKRESTATATEPAPAPATGNGSEVSAGPSVGTAKDHQGPPTPQSLLELGHSHAASNQAIASLTAYREALALSPPLSADPMLRENLRAMAAHADPTIAATALEMWVGSTNDPAAKEAAILAAASTSIERRRLSRPIIRRYKLAKDVDWLTAYGLDLEQEPTCNKRREAVANLRALKKPAAIPALTKATRKRAQRRNACLVNDVRSAIRYLKRIAAVAK